MKKHLFTLLLIVSALAAHSSNYYWVGGSGNWTEYSTHWATSSGGTTFHTQSPQPDDSVFFDGNSFTSSGQWPSVLITGSHMTCGSMTWTADVQNTPILYNYGSLDVYGSLTFVPEMYFYCFGDIYLKATTPGHTITMTDISVDGDMIFSGPGGEWTLLHPVYAMGGGIILNNGTLNTDGQEIWTTHFSSTGSDTRSLITGSSVFNVIGPLGWEVTGTGFSLSSGTSKIVVTSTLFTTISGLVYYDITLLSEEATTTINGDNTYHFFGCQRPVIITGNNVFDQVTFSRNTTFNGSNTFHNFHFQQVSYTLADNTTQTFLNPVYGNGFENNRITLNGGSNSYLSQSNGSFCMDYTTLQNIKATGGASFYTGPNSVDLGGNTGWQLYQQPAISIQSMGEAPCNGIANFYASPTHIQPIGYTWFLNGVLVASGPDSFATIYEFNNGDTLACKVWGWTPGCEYYHEASSNEITMTATQSEINVKGNMVSIADGDVSPSLADHTAFGIVAPSTPVTRTYTIENTGTSPLTVSAINISGTDAVRFAVSGISFPVSIAPDSSFTFTLTFNGTGIKVHNARVNIMSIDCDEATYDFSVNAQINCLTSAFTTCPTTIVRNLSGTQTTVNVSYAASAPGSPIYTYVLSGATTRSGSGNGSGQSFNVGVTNVSVTATNLCGTGTCNFTVTVNDITPPVVITQNITIPLDANGTANIQALQVDNGSNDVFGIATMTVSPNTFTCSNTGSNTAILTVTDANGNSRSASAIVTVLDTTPPNAIGRDLTVYLGTNGAAFLSAEEIDNGSTDACGIAYTGLLTTAYDCTQKGPNTQVLMISDLYGNRGYDTVIVTVLDTIKPTVIARDITVTLGNNDSVYITPDQVNNGSYDNCGIISIILDRTGFSCSETGNNSVTLTVTDVNGNSQSATATVTIQGGIPAINSSIFIGNTVSWNNLPLAGSGQSPVITGTTSFNGTVVSINADGGDLNATTCAGIGVTGGNVSNGCDNSTDYKNATINKNQSISVKLNDANLGISNLIVTTGYTGKVKVIGKRNNKKVITFNAYITANVYDTFNFSRSCRLKGVCLIDEVKFELADNNCNNCNTNAWDDNGFENNDDGNYDDDINGNDDNDEFDDGYNCVLNCGFSIKNLTLSVAQKEECNISTAHGNGIPKAGSVVALSGTLSVGSSTVHSLGANSDGNFTTGSPNNTNYAKRLIAGYNKKGKPAAWEVSNECHVRPIRMGQNANKAKLPVGTNAQAAVYEFAVTGVAVNGAYIYGTRLHKTTGEKVTIVWKVSEYYQQVWVSMYEVTGFAKTDETQQNKPTATDGNVSEQSSDLRRSSTLYPNPASDEFQIAFENMEKAPATLKVFDVNGRIVLSKELENVQNTNTVNIADLHDGLYIVELKQGDYTQILRLVKTLR